MQRKAAIAAIAIAIMGASCANASGATGSAPTRATRLGASAPARSTTVAATRWRAIHIGSPGPLTTDAEGTVVVTGTRVVALRHDGTTQWSAPVTQLGIQYPALGAGLVVVSTVVDDGAKPSGSFVALDRTTGATRWRVPVVGEPGPVTITSTRVFAATTNGAIRALRRDGTDLWSVRLPVQISSRGNVAFDAATNTIGLVVHVDKGDWFLDLRDARDGHETGAFDLGAADPPSAVAAAGAGRLVVGDGETHELLRIDLHTRVAGAALRTSDGFDPASVPAVDRDLAVVVDRSGGVTAMDLGDGQQRWHADLSGPVLDTRPVISGDRVAVARWLGPVVMLGRADGRMLPFPRAADGVPASFSFDGDTVVESLRLARPDRVEAWSAP
jgi:outer membrane protein assembly factor BamB